MTAPNQPGEFLRARRSRLQPSDVGLPSGVGLRREELAAVAGVRPARRRNTIRYTYLHPAARDLFPDWEASAASTTAHLRALEADHQAEPGSRDHDAMTLLSMIASGEQTPGRLPSPGRPPA